MGSPSVGRLLLRDLVVSAVQSSAEYVDVDVADKFVTIRDNGTHRCCPAVLRPGQTQAPGVNPHATCGVNPMLCKQASRYQHAATVSRTGPSGSSTVASVHPRPRCVTSSRLACPPARDSPCGQRAQHIIVRFMKVAMPQSGGYMPHFDRDVKVVRTRAARRCQVHQSLCQASSRPSCTAYPSL